MEMYNKRFEWLEIDMEWIEDGSECREWLGMPE
jgi:hypothetical protein